MLEILKMIIIYCIGYVHSDTMTFLNEEKNTCNRWRTIYNYCIDLRDLIRSLELNVAIINLRTGGHQLIFKSCELTVAIINLRTGAHQLIFQSFVLTVAIINLHTGAHLLIFIFLPQKGLIISMQVIKYTYLPVKSKSLITESLSCSLYSLWCSEWRHFSLSGSGRLGQLVLGLQSGCCETVVKHNLKGVFCTWCGLRFPLALG